MPSQNTIALDSDGNITVQDGTGSITLNSSQATAVQLRELTEAQLDGLMQIAGKQAGLVPEFFQALLGKVAKEKNIVHGDMSNVQVVNIGDKTIIEFHYHRPEIKLPKDLTLSIPKTNPDDIVGRDDDLTELYEMLSNDKRVVVVNGLGGIGKTTLAQAYAFKYYDAYEHIAWVTQTSENILNDFINTDGLLKNLKVETSNPEPERLFKEILMGLKGIEEKPNLLVIDNVEQAIYQYRHMLPAQPKWHLLLTSREEIEGFTIKPLDFLTESQAVELFRKHYPYSKLSEADIKELIKTVDYHTLTIEILAKTAKTQYYDAETLKSAIEKDARANVKIPHGLGQVDRITSYLRTVFTMSRLSGPEIWLMKQFVCLPPEFLSYDLLNELIMTEESVYREVFAETLNGLAQKGWLLQNRETDSYKMHRIIANVVKKEKEIRIEEVKILIDTVTQKLSIDQTKDNPVDKFIWIPFGKAVTGILERNIANELAVLQNNLATVLQVLGEYEEAKTLLRKAVASAESSFGQNHPTTAIRYSNLATVLQDLGEYEEAKTLLRKAVASDESNFGQDHPTTAKRYSNLALVLKDLGEYEEAKTLLRKAVASAESNFGQNHPTTAISYSNLAIVLKNLGEYKEAKALLKKTVASAESNFGQNHPNAAMSYSNLATVLQVLGEYEEAKALLRKAVASDESSFGQNHPNTAIRYSNLAMLLRVLGECEEAKTLLRKAVASGESNFGQNHPTTAIRYSNLAAVLKDLGEDKEAKDLSGKALIIFKRTLPAGHPRIAVASEIYEAIKKEMGE